MFLGQYPNLPFIVPYCTIIKLAQYVNTFYLWESMTIGNLEITLNNVLKVSIETGIMSYVV